MQRARERIREITAQRRLLLGVEVIVQDLNNYLRGWANYFRYGNSRLHFTRITTYALRRLALFVAKRHNRRSGYGMTVVAFVSPNRMGLVNLDRLVVTPSPFRDWRVSGPSRMPAVKGVGEPCAGEPHARFDVAAGGNWHSVGTCRANAGASRRPYSDGVCRRGLPSLLLRQHRRPNQKSLERSTQAAALAVFAPRLPLRYKLGLSRRWVSH